ncbi:uncharacterized protein LOC110729137 isoform X1 [Chenopodium quinoa]|uniref:uncharacterized protein LOC110729137 isoform X1 n=1 Tax=Chenopodium quinoa TaxID=63459 RepID=UPI000B78267A|nr:uncharacterized protein LOC110729137 isoform X1 [Chenopodium quinoa]
MDTDVLFIKEAKFLRECIKLQYINMPKARRDRSVSFERSRKSPVPCSSSLSCETKAKSPPATVEDLKEWEDARCAVCMEHPHNAVLLICSAYDKGCRPYMCDTSYRHSNCLDQFRKSFTEDSTETLTEEGIQPAVQSSDIVAVETVVTSQDEGKSQGSVAEEIASMHKLQQKLVCPLCRGQISGWVVAESARDFMNAKIRSCACETCEFSGNYTDLRKHARVEHPLVRPSEADPERQRNWRRLERQRDIGDVLSTIQSSFMEDQDEDANLQMDERGWITIYFLFRVWRPSSSPRSSSSWSGTSRSRTRAQQGTRRRSSARLWGESLEAETGSASVEDEDSSDDGSVPWRRRVRRRLPTPDDES